MRTTRRLTPDDLPALWALEQTAHSDGWSEAALLVELTHEDAVVIGAFLDDSLIAYIAIRDVAGERWVFNIATYPTERRQGHARALLKEAFALPRSDDMPFWLEVRESNVGARRLYESLGFVEVGVRPNYYACEDGTREGGVQMRATTAPAQTP